MRWGGGEGGSGGAGGSKDDLKVNWTELYHSNTTVPSRYYADGSQVCRQKRNQRC